LYGRGMMDFPDWKEIDVADPSACIAAHLAQRLV
jgi:hypothetical protein